MLAPMTRNRLDGCSTSAPKSHACGTPSSSSSSAVSGLSRAVLPAGSTANPLPYTSASRSLPYSTRTSSVLVSTMRQNSSSSARASARAGDSCFSSARRAPSAATLGCSAIYLVANTSAMARYESRVYRAPSPKERPSCMRCTSCSLVSNGIPSPPAATLNTGFHPCGGTIFAIPASAPTAEMLLMYANGSANSSAVGWNTGQSGTAVLLVRF
mmetsp:Transcript_20270/g.50461  ORF Transcript_20270/g.50461 Transcript_20270/m.50461 type:complete len:213 (+) Transcript_20270:1260-1898(+)